MDEHPAERCPLPLCLARTLVITGKLLRNAGHYLRLLFVSKTTLAARCLVLEKELALYVERRAKPRRFDDASRITLALIASCTNIRSLLVAVQPRTVIGWKKKLWKLYWRRKSRPRGRPPLPPDAQRRIYQWSRDNPSWGADRIRDELVLKLGNQYADASVRKYMYKHRDRRGGRPISRQRWSTFVHNQARTMLACDFLTEVTLGFVTFYVLVVMEIESRKIVHWNVTDHPTPEWTMLQLRQALPHGRAYRFLVHDRDGLFSPELDRVVKGLGVRPLKTPPRSPKANAFVERLIGTIRRECLDFFLILNERHLRRILREWVTHYNHARPHSRLGPGIPDPPPGLLVEPQTDRHRLPAGYRVLAKPVLSGLHHEYSLEKIAA